MKFLASNRKAVVWELYINHDTFHSVDAKTVEGDHEDASHNHKRPLETTCKRQEKEEVNTLFCKLRDILGSFQSHS